MASGGLEKEWKQIEEEITCSICRDLFTDPKTIPCLHMFCKQCIEQSIESSKKMASTVICPLYVVHRLHNTICHLRQPTLQLIV